MFEIVLGKVLIHHRSKLVLQDGHQIIDWPQQEDMEGIYGEEVESVDMVHLLPERDGFMDTILEVSLVLFTDTEAIIVSLDVSKCSVISNIKLAEFVGGAPVALSIFDTYDLATHHHHT